MFGDKYITPFYELIDVHAIVIPHLCSRSGKIERLVFSCLFIMHVPLLLIMLLKLLQLQAFAFGLEAV